MLNGGRRGACSAPGPSHVTDATNAHVSKVLERTRTEVQISL